MRISRQAYYKRNRACDARARHAQEVMGFVMEKRLRQSRIGARKLYSLMRAEPEVSVKVGETVYLIFCEIGTTWFPANGPITNDRQPS